MYDGDKTFSLGAHILLIFRVKRRTLFIFCIRQTRAEKIFSLALWNRFLKVQQGYWTRTVVSEFQYLSDCYKCLQNLFTQLLLFYFYVLENKLII